MKKILTLLLMFMSMMNVTACSADSNEPLADPPSSGGGLVWGNDFDAFLTPIMQNNTTAISKVANGNNVKDTKEVYDLSGRSTSSSNARKGVYIVKQGGNTRKVVSNGK